MELLIHLSLVRGALPLALFVYFVTGLPDRRGPQFSVEPSNQVDFLNSSGAVIPCSVQSQPQPPTIQWLKQDNSPLLQIPSLRQIGSDGSLVFLPFTATEYRQDVHSAIYKCRASNPMGTLESRGVRVRASVKQHFDTQVFDDFVIRGNTGVLRCHIPSFVKEYVTVTAWVRSDGSIIHLDSPNGGRYTVFPSGELHIHQVDPLIDGSHQYRCQTKHRLSGEVKLSANTGRLIITEPHSNVPPKVTDRKTYLVSQVREKLTLPCAAQGSPPPAVTWYYVSSKLLSPVPKHGNGNDERMTQRNGILTIRDARISDTGKYVCLANNSVGEDKAETDLVIRAPLIVSISPRSVTGHEAEENIYFNCSVVGHPFRKIVWKKDAQNIVPSNRLRVADNVLHIRSLRREDKGMYQCFAFNEFESSQAAAELHLGDDPPRFTHSFSESNVEPGAKVSLKCSSTGSPLPQITWTVDEMPIGEHLRLRVGDYVTTEGLVNSFVNISSAKVEDGGVYRCRASNGIHSIAHMGRINVFGAPFVKPMRNVTVISGESVQIHCPVAGYPLESISWERKGVKLPQNHRQVVYPNGTLSIRNVGRGSDEDQYRCVASNKVGDSAFRDVALQVIVAPLISPFSAAPNLREGMRSMLTCSVLEGDPPFSFKWLKDGTPIESQLNANIASSNEFSSTLFIAKVQFQDNGNYTCIISNSAAATNYSINMLVKVPPKWVVTPNDAEIVEGQDVTIDCQATGYPTPRIWWEHAEQLSGSLTPSHYQPVISNSHIHALENGSLIIKEVTKGDEGFYLCQATNAVSSGISKVIKVTVRVPPSFKTAFNAQTTKKGEYVELKCEAEGEKPMTIVWTKDRMQFDPRAESRYELIQSESDEGLSVALKIKSVDRRDSALFTCTAANAYGKDEYNIQVIVQEPPDKPENVISSQIESRTAVISWTLAYSGNSLILSYQLEFKPADKGWESSTKTIETASGNTNSATLRKLKPLTTYHVRVKSENGIGWSPYSDSLQFTTDEEAPSSPPKNVHVYPLTSRSLQVTWKQPSTEGHNGLIKGYYLGYRVLGSSESYIFKTVSVESMSVNENTDVKITDLKRATKYSVIVQAFNSKGPGPQSEEVIGETLVNDPPPFPALSVGIVSHTSVELHWAFDDTYLQEGDHELLINGYYLYYKSPHSSWEERQVSGQMTSYSFSDLYCGTYYQFYLIAYNSIGKGDPSQVVATKTKGSPPEPPRLVHHFITANSSAAGINLTSWRTNGCPINNFVIQYKIKSKQFNDWILLSNNIVPDQRLIEIVDLRPGTWYSLLVVAHSDPGPTEKEYTFATLTDNGATISPLDLTRPLTYTSLSVIIPTSCAVIVLIVILFVAFLVICKKRTPAFEDMPSNEEQMCERLREDRLLSSENAILSVLDQHHRKESSLSEMGETPHKLYYPMPTPYAMNQVESFKQLHLVDAHEGPHTFDRLTLEQHTYDIPFPPKWV